MKKLRLAGALGVATALIGMFAALSASTGCSGSSSLCHPTKESAAERILTPWCERYVECDASRGTVAECVSERIGQAAVRPPEGCGATCSDDAIECSRSTCKDDEVDECATTSRAMACSDQVEGGRIVFPDFCDSCYR